MRAFTRSTLVAGLAAAVVAALLMPGLPLHAQDAGDGAGEGPNGAEDIVRGNDESRDEGEPEFVDEEPAASTDESTEDYLAALALQRKGRFRSAQRAFQKMLEKYPNSVHAEDAHLRSDVNHFAGVTIIHESGPPSRRIDVAVMGDGFTYEKKSQALQEEWAELCLKVLWSEAAFEEYKDYFNYYFVRLVSEDEKVDPNMTEEQKARIDEKNKNRRNKRKYDYSTALDCKAAGPQGQVMADRRLVYKWLEVAAREVPGCSDDAQVIAFARFGKLGMGGGGVANVGRPDKSVTVHEFGHSFVGLLDEYTNNPNPPRRPIRAANATSDPEVIPWQHWLDARKKGVEVIEGGATFKKGVWRPAKTCAMNAAGATGFCPVCREAAVLRIYSYLTPIDSVSPPIHREVQAIEGDDTTLSVFPMEPRTHDLEVSWYLEIAEIGEGGPEPLESGETTDFWPGAGGSGGPRWNPGERLREDREEFAEPPLGEPSKLGEKAKTKRDEPTRHDFAVGELPCGRWRVTVEVRDTTDWVLKDENHLLVERRTWWVDVRQPE